MFPVIHPLKSKVRLVFDAKAAFGGVSLNDILMDGPDLNNSLRGVLLRFRTKAVAFSVDIAHMFNCFFIPSNQRDLLRFFWWEDNNPEKNLVQFRSKVHLFGACSSPAVAVFGLKLIAELGKREDRLSNLAVEFIQQSFYMDDGMGSESEEIVVV